MFKFFVVLFAAFIIAFLVVAFVVGFLIEICGSEGSTYTAPPPRPKPSKPPKKPQRPDGERFGKAVDDQAQRERERKVALEAAEALALEQERRQLDAMLAQQAATLRLSSHPSEANCDRLLPQTTKGYLHDK